MNYTNSFETKLKDCKKKIRELVAKKKYTHIEQINYDNLFLEMQFVFLDHRKTRK